MTSPAQRCKRCGRVRRHHAHGRCHTCYQATSTAAGRGGPGLRKGAAAVAGRLEDYAEIRAAAPTLFAAAQRLGVSYRTAQRYDAALTRPP